MAVNGLKKGEKGGESIDFSQKIKNSLSQFPSQKRKEVCKGNDLK
jgi:hypothetical protein